MSAQIDSHSRLAYALEITYREQKVRHICQVCNSLAPSGCKRCNAPLCQEHLPAAEMRCQDCENTWIEKAAGRELGRWGVASTLLGSVAKWSLASTAFGVSLGIVVRLIPGAPLWLWTPVALLLLGIPMAAISICMLPFARTAERSVDLLLGGEREHFLSERTSETSSERLLSSPGKLEGDA